MIERWLLFIWPVELPSGGWNDFHGLYETLVDAERDRDTLAGDGLSEWQIVSLNYPSD